jgi:hypothetical protein
MSDGKEERKEQEQRRKWDDEKDGDDRLERFPVDPRQPERKES